jgi:ubiquinone/menaquinone biosynthesis C-methylase UbiE
MTELQTQRDYYTETASAYDDLHGRSIEHVRAVRHVVSLLQLYGLKTVLDVGAGTGRGVHHFLKAGFDSQGVEPVQAMIDEAVRKGVPKERLHLGEGEKLQFQDGSFDAASEFGVLHHVKNPASVVSEMMRVSRSAVFLSDTNRFGRASALQRFAKFAAWRSGMWGMAYWLKKGGKSYDYSDCDGLAYSYSVYDNYYQLSQWADTIILIPTKVEGRQVKSWFAPLFTSSHVLLCAFRKPLISVPSP